MTTLPDVQVGQVWEDCDWRQRQKPRRVRVVAVPPALDTYPNPRELGIVVENVATGKKSTIRLRRFKPNSTGYRLIEAAPGAISEVDVWTERRSGSTGLDWHIRVDGVDHGGGSCATFAEAHRQAADYLRDIGA